MRWTSQRLSNRKRKILKVYEDDVNKYASNADEHKIMQLYRSVPRRLAKETRSSNTARLKQVRV